MELKKLNKTTYMKNLFSFKTNNFLLRLLIVALIPLVIISFFNNPATDDFYLANLSLKHGLIDVHFWHYNNWSGRYFSNGILFFSPLYLENFFLYKIIPIALLFIFIFSVHHFVSSIFHSISNKKKWSISSLIILLFLIQVTDICSAFYWLPAAITYHFGISLSLLFVSFYIRLKKTNRYVYLVLSLLFIVFSMGCNEIITILNSLLIGVYFLYQIYSSKKIDYTLLIVVLIAALFASIELFAPGNSARNERIVTDGQYNLIHSTYKSFVHSILFFLKWFPLVLLFAFLFSKKIYQSFKQGYFKFMHPIWAFFILFSILFISLFPSFYIQNNIIADRSLNIIYFYFIIFGLYSILCSLKFAKDKYGFEIKLNKSSKIAVSCIIVFFTFSDTPITNAYEDLANGKAFVYNQQMKSRFDLIKNTSEKQIIVPALTKKPQTIYQDIFMGLTPNLDNWKNQDISEYYGKSVIVKPSEIEIIE